LNFVIGLPKLNDQPCLSQEPRNGAYLIISDGNALAFTVPTRAHCSLAMALQAR
jgi:hypothetical protein